MFLGTNCLVVGVWVCREGVELLKQFKQEVDMFEAERQELANAEKLFDLPITMYQELIQVQKELKGLEQIFSIYQDQKVPQTQCLVLLSSLNLL